MSEPREVSLEDQVRCVRREIALRQRVYGRMVAAGKLKQADADRGIAQMTAVLATLTRVAQITCGGWRP